MERLALFNLFSLMQRESNEGCHDVPKLLEESWFQWLFSVTPMNGGHDGRHLWKDQSSKLVP